MASPFFMCYPKGLTESAPWGYASVLCVFHFNGCGDDKVLYRVDDLFTLRLVVVGFTNEVGGRAQVLEHVAVVSKLVAVYKEVAHVGGTLKGVNPLARGGFVRCWQGGRSSSDRHPRGRSQIYPFW